MKVNPSRLAAALAVIPLSATACSGAAEGPSTAAGDESSANASTSTDAPEGGGEEIVIYDGQWQSIAIENAIFERIVEQGYGHDVKVEVVSVPVMNQAMNQGDIHVNLELWRNNMRGWYDEITGSGQMVDLGETFDTAAQGFYVPRYVIEGDEERGIEAVAPELESVDQLPEHTDVFVDPEDESKGRLVSCPASWECAEMNRVKMSAYGLTDSFNIQEPGAAGALDAAIVGAYERGEPILTYYWEPTAIMGRFDFVRLDEPEWTQQCQDALDEVRESGDVNAAPTQAGCAYKDIAIHKGVVADLEERAPEVVDFLEAMSFDTEMVNTIAAEMDTQDLKPEGAAEWFLTEHEDIWTEWVPAEVAERVSSSLSA